MVLFKIKMKAVINIFLLVLMCLNRMASQRVYTNVYYCNSTFTLYDSGRADWYDCEIDETFYGHYWQRNDTLFVETFCSSESHEDHRCFSPRLDICLIKSDTLLNVGFREVIGDGSCYSDSIYFFPSPHVYIRTDQ